MTMVDADDPLEVIETLMYALPSAFAQLMAVKVLFLCMC